MNCVFSQTSHGPNGRDECVPVGEEVREGEEVAANVSVPTPDTFVIR